MIIDFHTHIFPEKIASRAIASLEQKAKMRAHVSGVEASLRASMDKAVLICLLFFLWLRIRINSKR